MSPDSVTRSSSTSAFWGQTRMPISPEITRTPNKDHGWGGLQWGCPRTNTHTHGDYHCNTRVRVSSATTICYSINCAGPLEKHWFVNEWIMHENGPGLLPEHFCPIHQRRKLHIWCHVPLSEMSMKPVTFHGRPHRYEAPWRKMVSLKQRQARLQTVGEHVQKLALGPNFYFHLVVCGTMDERDIRRASRLCDRPHPFPFFVRSHMWWCDLFHRSKMNPAE